MPNEIKIGQIKSDIKESATKPTICRPCGTRLRDCCYPSYPSVIPLLSLCYPNKMSIVLLPAGVLLARCTWDMLPFFTLNT